MNKLVVTSVVAAVSVLLLATTANAAIEQETINSGQQAVPSLPPSANATLDLIGAQFNQSLGVLNSVTLSLTANLTGSSVGSLRSSAGSDPWPVTWAYSGNVSLSSLALSSSWNGSGVISVNPSVGGAEVDPISVTPTTGGLVLSSGLAQFIGNGNFDLSATLQTLAIWYSTPGNGTEFANFNTDAGATLLVTYDYTPESAVSAIPEPTTIIAGASLLLPFGAGLFRVLRRKSAA